MDILDYFISKKEIKEINKEIIRNNGDIVKQSTKTTTTLYNIPNDIKEVVIKEIYKKEI